MKESNSGSVTFLGLLGLLFIGLKLGGFISWSWWFVTLPLWGGITIVAAIGIIWLAVMGVCKLFNS